MFNRNTKTATGSSQDGPWPQVATKSPFTGTVYRNFPILIRFVFPRLEKRLSLNERLTFAMSSFIAHLASVRASSFSFVQLATQIGLAVAIVPH